MRIIDEEGRLFGVVNVIDALVVVFVLTVVVAGVALFLDDPQPDTPSDENPDTPQEPEPLRYATVEYTAPLDSQAARLSPGAELQGGGVGYNVTDVYRSTTPSTSAHVTARIAYRGNLIVNDDRVFAGDQIDFTTGESRISATVSEVDLDDGLINTTGRSIVVRINESSGPIGRAVESGDEIQVGGNTIGVVTGLQSESHNATDIGLAVTTRETSIGPSFGGRTVKIGQRLGVVTDVVIIRGTVVALGTNDPEDI